MIRVQATAIDLAAELADFGSSDSSVGGIASFVGRVRDRRDDGQRLVALTLDHYPGMTERQLDRLADEAWQRWELRQVLIVHRVGRMVPGETIVLVATAASHRAAAFEACQFLIDALKTQATFWKHEEAEDGSGGWVAAKASDDDAAGRWTIEKKGTSF